MPATQPRTSPSGLTLTERFAGVLDVVIFVCLLAVIVITLIPYGTVDPWWEAAFECAVLALTALWICEVLLRGNWQAKRLFILLPMAILTAYAFFQTVQLPEFIFSSPNGPLGPRRTLTIDRYQTHLTAVKMLVLTLFTGMLLLHTSSSKRFIWLVRVVIGVGLFSAVFGILRQLLQSPSSTQGFGLPFLYYGMGYGQFISSNAFAYVAEMSFALVLGLFLGGGVRRDRIPIYVAVAALIWTALVLSNSRGGILAMICQAIFILFVGLRWYFDHQGRRLDRKKAGPNFIGFVVRTVVVLVIAATLIIGVVWMGGDRLAGKQANNQNYDGTTRSEIWHSTWNLVKQHPFSGVGFGAYFLAIPQFQAGSGRLKVEQAHNDYLDLAASGGVIAVGLALWFIGMIIWRARWSLKSADSYRRAGALGALGGLLSVSVHSFVDFGLQLTGIAVLCAALVVIVAADSRVESTFKERQPPVR
jgi:O-antigen ligase